MQKASGNGFNIANDNYFVTVLKAAGILKLCK